MKWSILKLISNLRPRPFKWIQKSLDIEVEWASFKKSMMPHKGKFMIVGGIIMFPLYQPLIVEVQVLVSSWFRNNLGKNEPIPKIAESFGKQLVTGVFHDPEVQRESTVFVQDLVKRQLVLDSVLYLLADSIKNPQFLNESKVFGKDLILTVLKEEDVQKEAVNLMLKAIKDPEFKSEVIDLVRYSFSQPQVSETIADAFRSAMADQRCKTSLAQAMSASASEMIMNKETLEKLKLFTYFLVESESISQNGSIKQMIEMVVENFMKKKQQSSKESEFQRIFSEVQKDSEVKLSYQDRFKDLIDRSNTVLPNNQQSNKKRQFVL